MAQYIRKCHEYRKVVGALYFIKGAFRRLGNLDLDLRISNRTQNLKMDSVADFTINVTSSEAMIFAFMRAIFAIA